MYRFGELGYTKTGVVIFDGKIHLGFGIMLWMFFWVGDTWLNPITLLIGALLPDADHKHAPMGRILPLWLIFKHRTWTHTLQGVATATVITVAVWNLWAGVGMMVGYLSHLFLDACTPSGINWLGIKKRSVK